MLNKLAQQYFAFVAKRFPVMCASDEFHFLPRAWDAAKYYDRLDILDAGSIKDAIDELKHFRAGFSAIGSREGLGLEERIDLEMLIANIDGFLVEFEARESYRNNPLLYLKIVFIGLDHALNKPAESSKELVERVLSRLDAIPTLLNQGIENLVRVPESYYGYAVSMIADCKRYLESSAALAGLEMSQGSRPGAWSKRAPGAVEEFRKFLLSVKPCPDDHFFTDTIESSLRDHFKCGRSLDEIFQIGLDDWNENLENLEAVGKEIEPDLPWQEVYEKIVPDNPGNEGIISRYSSEAEKLEVFFRKQGLADSSQYSALRVTETPAYLRSVRGSASFAASLADKNGETDYFHITTGRSGGDGSEGERYARRLHREFRFLTAHETIPGHYLLDRKRRRLENPVRRQIESPLFYEGWASYAETLLSDYEYVIEPEDRLIDFRRRLWRAARCQIDAGTATGKLDREGSAELLQKVGFTEREALVQIDRFRLNPGYQLCYCLGSYEIRELRNKFGFGLGLGRFHEHLLDGGEIPFSRIEQRLRAIEKTDK